MDNFGSAGALTLTIAMWFSVDSIATFQGLLLKDTAGSGQALGVNTAGKVIYRHQWSGAASVGWTADTTVISTGVNYHLAVVYDASAASNDPTIYVNGVVQSLTESSGPPSGSPSADGALSLRLGLNAAGGLDLNGRIGWFCYDNTAWTAEQVNRHRWTGRPGGSVAVIHPLTTDKLNNEGTATANGAATGTTVVGMAVPVLRPGVIGG